MPTRLELINEMGAPLLQERDLTCLLERILLAAKASTNADGGTLYRRMEDGQALRVGILRTDSRCGLPREAHCAATAFPCLPPRGDADPPNDALLAAPAAIALSQRLLICRLEELFESFINPINPAIDGKSPSTGGHCQRVPALTMLLADAAA